MSGATDRMRELLDERGVEWEALSDQQEGDFTITATRWHDGEGGLLTMFISEPHGSTWDFFWLPTPEQAIDATLGSGTCHNASYRLDESRFHCSECGFGCWVKDVADGHDKVPKYCPNCGRRVVD